MGCEHFERPAIPPTAGPPGVRWGYKTTSKTNEQAFGWQRPTASNMNSSPGAPTHHLPNSLEQAYRVIPGKLMAGSYPQTASQAELVQSRVEGE